MNAGTIRSIATPIFYGNPFWRDPIDPASDPVIAAATAEIAQWEPIRRERTRTALWIYAGLWVVDVILLIGFFSMPSTESGEAWGIPAGVLFLAQFLVTPGILAAWIQPASKRVSSARATIRAGSTQRYQQWLAHLQASDPTAHGQVILWHQGNQAADLAKAQLVTQLYTAYQVTQTRNDIRRRS
jgi:hypothetical protein